jgi:hypothetical protein
VYAGLPEEERKKTTILATSYSLAGAVDYFGKHHGLPPARSGHMTYSLWGPGELEPDTVLLVGFRKEGIEKVFDQVEEVTTAGHSLANRWYQNTPILLGRGLKLPVAELWPKLREWD